MNRLAKVFAGAVGGTMLSMLAVPGVAQAATIERTWEVDVKHSSGRISVAAWGTAYWYNRSVRITDLRISQIADHCALYDVTAYLANDSVDYWSTGPQCAAGSTTFPLHDFDASNIVGGVRTLSICLTDLEEPISRCQDMNRPG